MRHVLQKRRRIRRIGFFIFGGFALFALWFSWEIYSLLIDLPKPERITDRTVAQSTKIFDRTGTTLLYEIHGEENRTIISLRDVPAVARLAALAAEDLYFYSHRGLDLRGIIRAALKNISSGAVVQGGSTITQQLVKKSLLGDERTFRRKIREQILAVLVEQKYTKDEILELYLNQIPYGSNAYGIAAAAKTFFGKTPEDLTLAEASTLAALPRAPTFYSPYGSHKDALLERKNWIIDRMAEANFIKEEEAIRAKKEKLSFLPPAQTLVAPHFVIFVREYLNETYGETFVERGGLRVITTLDVNLQKQAEKIIKEGAEKNEKLVSASNASLVAISPKTGEILAMVGSRDYWGKPSPEGCNPGIDCQFDPNVNVALRPRQPGSAFKPFVYATAFAKGYAPETVLFDIPTEFDPTCNADGTPGPATKNPDDCYHPRDYDGKFRGPVTLRTALAQSLNVPAVKLLYLAGINDSIDTAETMGITTLRDRSRFGLSLVLGGGEVTLLEMTSAFGVFANDGSLAAKTPIIRVEDSKGTKLEEKKGEPAGIIDPEITRIMNDILSDNAARVPVFSPQSSLYFPDREVAAKTGTTQDYRDAWVVGYTPSLAVGVWAGNNNNAAMNRSALSVMVAAPMWHAFIESALRDTPAESFPRAEDSTAQKPAIRGVYRAGEVIKIDKISKKLATAYTPPELIEEISYGDIKSILAFVDKEDPLGPPPENPAADPQFKNWQEALSRWLAQNYLPQGEGPKELDDLHTPEKQPSISFTVPQETAPVVDSLERVSAEINSSFPLREVSLFLNDSLINSRVGPFASNTFEFPLPEKLAPETYNIKITVYDTVGNMKSKEIIISVVRSPAL